MDEVLFEDEAEDPLAFKLNSVESFVFAFELFEELV